MHILLETLFNSRWTLRVVSFIDGFASVRTTDSTSSVITLKIIRNATLTNTIPNTDTFAAILTHQWHYYSLAYLLKYIYYNEFITLEQRDYEWKCC